MVPPQLGSKVSLQICSLLNAQFKRKDEKYVASAPPPRLPVLVADIAHHLESPLPAPSIQGTRTLLRTVQQAGGANQRLARTIKPTRNSYSMSLVS